MCGIIGLVRREGLLPGDYALIQRATASLAHRGPDGQGVWVGSHAAFGVARLAVRGGADAAQPLLVRAHPGSEPIAVLAFNGEVYSAPDDAETRAMASSQSDTIALAEHLRKHGLDRLDAIDGMFAFAFWETASRRLLLARDRWGEKPLYYASLPDGGLAFASEPGALIPIPEIDWTLDPNRVASFVRTSFWSGCGTPWPSVKRLRPGEAIEWREGVVKVLHWGALDAKTFATGYTSPDLDVRRLAAEAVRSRLVGDRRIGALASGGLDSSLIVALAAEAGQRLPVWTVRWDHPGWDEREYARLVGEHLALDHHFVDFGPQDVERRIESFVDAFDEPFADESILPTCAVLEAASDEVAVVLTGDGGDELFGGYRRYGWSASSHAEYLDAFAACPERVLRRLLLPDLWTENASPCPVAGRDLRDQRRWIDLNGYLSDDLLRKMDRAAGRVGVENRAPFLARDFSRWALSLSARKLWRDQSGKQPLRALATPLLPRTIVERGKQGFGVPLSVWFRGPLRSWLSDRLHSGTLAATGWIRPGSLESVLNEHSRGQADHARSLFNLLILAIWLERWPRRFCGHPPPKRVTPSD